MKLADAATPLASRLSYAQCWEDHRLLVKALAPTESDRVLSIASGGENSFALALAGAGEVVAVDLSLPQIAVTELKLAATSLDYDDYLVVLGLADGDPLTLYRKIRSQLSDGARGWMDAHEGLIAEGILDSGKFERFFGMFRRALLPLIHRQSWVERFVTLDDPKAQRHYYDRVWNTWRWRGLFRLFFSQPMIARFGRSPEHFAQVEGAIGDRLIRRLEHVLVSHPMASNPYLQWVLTGSYDPATAHPHLSEDGHAALREARPRIRVVHGSLESLMTENAETGFDAFNLSNLFEYLPVPAFEALYGALIDAANPGARLAYWNLFVPRWRPSSLAERVDRDEARSRSLLLEDRAPFYGAFHVETVR